jgi:hypothetical protein
MILGRRARRSPMRQLPLPGLVVLPGACLEVPRLEDNDEVVSALANLMARMLREESEERDEH